MLPIKKEKLVFKKSLYFESCQGVIKSFFEFSKKDLESEILSRDKRLSKASVHALLSEFTSDLDVSVEVLRCIICNCLDLDSTDGYVAFKLLVELGSTHMKDKLEFCSKLSYSEKQGVLQICMHMIVSAKNDAICKLEV